jgi:hypothetical protein
LMSEGRKSTRGWIEDGMTADGGVAATAVVAGSATGAGSAAGNGSAGEGAVCATMRSADASSSDTMNVRCLDQPAWCNALERMCSDEDAGKTPSAQWEKGITAQ